MNKQVIVMRKDLNMRKGKMIAQGSHAALKVFFDIMEPIATIFSDKPEDRWTYQMILPKGEIGDQMKEWIDGIFTKICVAVDSEQELLDIYAKAKELDLPCSLIQDAGLTEFNNEKTYTCCAIGPASAELIDPITESLKLL